MQGKKLIFHIMEVKEKYQEFYIWLGNEYLMNMEAEGDEGR